jgi:tetratricopeptide (TPR) repeat protein
MKSRSPIFTLALAVSTFAFVQHGALLAQSPKALGSFNSGMPSSTSSTGSFRHSGSIEGTVKNLNGNSLKDVRVDLHNVGDGSVVASAYTSQNGAFEFGSVPEGSYEVVALSGLNQASERINVASFNSTVSLRLPISDVPHDGAGNNTISVAQYKIPPKARDEFIKSQEASRKSKPEEAEKHLARALEIYPDFSDALTVRAMGLLMTNLPAAIADLEHAIKADGNNSLALTILGAAMNSQAKFDEALLYLQRSETLSPDRWQTYFELAKTNIGKSDFAAGLRYLDKTVSMMAQDYSPIHLLRGRALFSLHRYAEASGELEAYLQKEPNSQNAGAARNMRDQAQRLLARN